MPCKDLWPCGAFLFRSNSDDCIPIASGESTRKRSPVSWSGLHRCQRGRSVCLLIDPLDGFHCLPSTRRYHVLDGQILVLGRPQSAVGVELAPESFGSPASFSAFRSHRAVRSRRIGLLSSFGDGKRGTFPRHDLNRDLRSLGPKDWNSPPGTPSPPLCIWDP